ncbi:hypothetical protein NN561_020405 [Cricetulus griseus]
MLSAQCSGPLAVPSCSGSGGDAPPRPAPQRPPPSRHKGSSGAGVTDPWPRAAKRRGQGPGWVSLWHRRLPSRTTHSTLPRRLPVPPEESPGGAALRRQGVQPARGQALLATESPRLPVVASPRSSSPGLSGSKGRGPGWSPAATGGSALRSAPRC